MVAFCTQLKKAMQQKGISQTELCKRTGIPKGAMSQYLSGKFKPKQKRTYLIARALNVSKAWLMGFENADMERHDQQPSTPDFPLTNHEKKLILSYRKNPDMQNAVDTLLGVPAIQSAKTEKEA